MIQDTALQAKCFDGADVSPSLSESGVELVRVDDL